MKELTLTKEDVEETFREAADGFDIKNNVVQSLGRFQGEPDFVLYYAMLMQEGSSDYSTEDGDEYFEIKPAERAFFPHLPDAPYIYLSTSDDGFVLHNFAQLIPEGE